MILQEGMVVADKFRLERMIGQGGMGSVWKAHHTGLDVPCAVKFIEGELAKLDEAQKRFKREANAAAALRSPHVVQIYDYGVWEGTPYIAMELLEGQDLGKILMRPENGGKLPASEVNRIVQQVCKALTKAHAAGIVHRDLKPDNIFLVTEDDGPGLVKILDFGVAKQTSNVIDGSNTKTGAMLGTPYYMSPEQAQGIKAVDGRSDLWSLAVIVFQCITGRLPFESEALGDLLVKIIVHPIPAPSSMAEVPPGFDQWWFKTADRVPENRPPTAKAFAESLMLALGQSSVTDVNIDRAKLMKMGGATAVMGNSPMMNTPAGAQTPPQAQTPNPYHTPPQAMQAPPVSVQGAMQGSQPGVATGATFSGVEPPVSVPKKGLPMGLVAGAGALAIVGIALIGFVAVKGGKSHASGNETAATATQPSAAPSETVAAQPSAQPSATVAAPQPSAEPSAAPAVTTVAVAGNGGGGHAVVRPAVGGGGPKPATTPSATTVGAAKPPGSAAPAAPAQPKKPELGF